MSLVELIRQYAIAYAEHSQNLDSDLNFDAARRAVDDAVNALTRPLARASDEQLIEALRDSPPEVTASLLRAVAQLLVWSD
jgi:hypothetical protein